MNLFKYRTPCCNYSPIFLRLALGAIMIMHGYDKLFVTGPEGVAVFFDNLSIPIPLINAWFISLLEFGGGIAIVLGLFTRVLSLLFAGDMFVAFVTVHAKNGFFVKEGGYEFVMIIFAVALALACLGAGKYSLDRLLLPRVQKN
ncbi:MAG: hypothetical protein A2826_02545 [Candidatus Doudnabacteria bacterium RIFCSPHIGHO2_01_FULL_43_23]|uniref:DoxX family protein n=1 Tax=Candidatus Doudnabacteria bacterium RIFCSPHIGHO2_01_FULL_43_23 TaxID=1817822 RepID=A0A1F5NVW9_9BACT|nr:MAG: hypothetical protein A2826_02545 [Candidatus Doudnabacteria bacterium RIFCSPHIGHO2_01_FULL_43_23]